ncbi:MAG: alkene reductase [Nitrospinota bacterium]|nr:alkene reductase [Nitrospinota bacterium]
MSDSVNLFSPIKVGPNQLPNRIVMAPMTRNRAGAGNVPQAMNVTYYTQRVSAGLIITEGSQVSPRGAGYPLTPGIHDSDQVTGWQKITDAVHQKGGHIFLQLWHVGRVSHSSYHNGELPVAPSAIKPEGECFTYEGPKPFETPHALTLEEIPQIVNEFRQAAKNAMSAGFDGVEIHGANGYLLDQFLRDGTNHRNDEYGGSLENRTRLLLEVTQAVTDVWGENRVGVRLSPAGAFNSMSDSDPQTTFEYAADALNQFTLAYLHIVETLESVDRFDFVALRKKFAGLYMANSEYDLKRATEAIQQGRADMVSFGKLYIANPDLPERFAANSELNEPDVASFYGGTDVGYIDYPALTNV